jgi:hypothetical protein
MTPVAAVFLFGVIMQIAAAQDRPASASPAQNGTVTWQRLVRLHDGREFVSDGRLALDAALAKPSVLPSTVLPEATAKIIEGYLAAQLPDEFALSELSHPGAEQYIAPSGVVLDPIYVDYLRRTSSGSRLRLRMKGDTEPIVILLDAKAVGLLMPMKR